MSLTKLLTGCLVLNFLLLNPDTANSQWTRKSDALRKRGECPSVLYKGKIYVFGGFGEHPNFEKDNEVYDPAADKWTLTAPFPAGKEISHQSIVLIDDKIWHIGGRAVDANGPVSSQVIIYDISANTWKDGPGLKDPATGQALPLGAGGAALLGRTLHVFGGFGPDICTDQNKYHLTLDIDKWIADPVNTLWENKLAPMPMPRNHLSTAVLGGKIYALGGQFGHDCNGADQKYCHVYDAVTNTWTRLTDLPSPRSHTEAATFPVDGEIYMAGGQGTSGAAQKTVLVFTPASNNGVGAWRDATQFALPNLYYGISARVIGGNFIFSHGALSAITNERIETYTTPINRNTPYKFGFAASCFNQTVKTNSSTVVKNLLYTIEGEKQYALTSNAAWLKLTKNATGTALQSGVAIEATVDATGLAEGSYTATVTATGAGTGTTFISAGFCVNLTVSQDAGLITDITASSGRTYALGQLTVGTTLYTDRTYQATSVPAFLNNAPLVKTPNEDKGSTAATLLSFNLTKQATVYVAYDPRGTTLPAWLSTWQKLSSQIGINDPNISHLQLYSKVYPAGKVSLGGNLASPASGALNNYIVVAQPVQSYSLSITTNGSGAVTKNPDQATYAGGSNVTLTASPATGQQFTGWSGSATGTTNPLAITMDENKSIAANFAAAGKTINFTKSSQSVEVEQGRSETLLEYIATSNNDPVNAKLMATDGFGNVPTWLSVNRKLLSGINYTTGSEISFAFDATNLSIGTYTAKVTASATGYVSATLDILLTVKSQTKGALSNFKVNFQDAQTKPPVGWLRDYGQAFGQRTSAYQESGYTFGWLRKSDKTPLDLTKNGERRKSPSDILLATFIYMQGDDASRFRGTAIEGIWEAEVVNGIYDVTVSVGDGTQTDSKHAIRVEGMNAISNFVPTSTVKFKSATITIAVADGLLTIDAVGGVNTKINYVIIKPSKSQRPSVVAVNPEHGSVNISENTSISTSILDLPNGGINNATITSANVYLTEEATGVKVPSNVNGTGGGDAVTLVPAAPLKLSTKYRFNITSGVKDLSGAAFIPYTSTFTTATSSTSDVVTAKFDKIALPNATGRHSSVTIGPDGKLYALTIDGIIKRFVINSNGTLGNPELLYSLQDAYGPRQQRLAIGLAFDPSSTATNLIAWVTHSTYVFLDGPDWDGKLTKLSGASLQTTQDVLINLPRSSKDHLSNSIAFGPDKTLYFTQGSNSAMGKADQTWNNREEHLLSAAVLRLDVTKLGSLPLNVKTAEGGGTYNPYAANAPLTIYASGIRNAYDLVWHSNGSLYIATNGSAAGGNTPVSVPGTIRPDGSSYSGPTVPALSNVQQTQKDFLFRVVRGGYYGHPNPQRGEYVMNGGNPTSNIDLAQVSPYPVGTLPDANWRGYSFDFQNNASPNGSIEYKSSTFNGALKGKLLVVRYSQHDDIITLGTGGTTNDVTSATEGSGIEGFSGFIDPLDLTEDVKTGNLYVSEYGGNGKIVLLRPNAATTTQPTTLRINSGGSAVSASSGTFAADAYFTGSTSTSAFTAAIDNTTDDLLYQDYRKAYASGGSFGYRIPVANATYTVKLHFAELFFTTSGGRVLNVTAEGTNWLTNYDIFVAAGGKNIAKVETRNVTVSDGYLDLSFVSVIDKALICAIEIIPASGTTVTKAVTAPQQVNDEVVSPDGMLYPNPARNEVLVNLNELRGSISATITDAKGTLVLKQTIAMRSARLVRINVGALKTGVYLLTLQTAKGARTFKFIKE